MSNRQLTEKQRAAIRWVTALRSGRYNQCFGRATVLSIAPTGEIERVEHCAVAAYYAEIGVPHDYFLEDAKALFGGTLINRIINMNDQMEKSFAEIADYIEEMVLAEPRVMA